MVSTFESFTKLLVTVADYEKSIEILRRILSEHSDFDPYSLFKFFSKDNKTFITVEDIISLLAAHHITCTNVEAKTMITFYDSDLDGQLSYLEFCNFILTDNESKLKQTKFTAQNSIKQVTYEIEYSLMRIVEKEIALVKYMNYLLKNLVYKSDFNVVDVYSALDQQNLNYLSPNNFKNFLLQNGVNLNDNDVKLLFKRFDLDKDGKILFWEFKRILSIKSEDLIRSKSPGSSTPIEQEKTNKSAFGSTKTDAPQIQNNIDNKENNVELTLSAKPSDNPNKQSVVQPLISSINLKSSSGQLFDSTKLTNTSQLKSSPQKLNKSSITVKNDTRFFTESYNKSFFNSTSRSGLIKKEFITLEEQSFIEFLKDIIDIEDDVEKLRCSLARKIDFTLQDAYSMFESGKKGYVTAIDLKYTLDIFGLVTTNSEIDLLIGHYRSENSKRKDVLNFVEFCGILTPFSEDDQKILKLRDPLSLTVHKINKYDLFSEETKQLFKEFWEKILSSEKEVENWRKKLNLLRGFNIREMFNKLDRYQKNYLVLEDFTFYFKKNFIDYGVFANELLFRRIDKDRDDRIIYHEFTNEIFPNSEEFLY